MSYLGKNKKIFWYAVYFVLVTLVFLFLGFPSKSVQAYIRSLAEDRMAESDFSLAKVSLALPLGLKLHQVVLTPKEGKEGLNLKADSMVIKPDSWSFIKGEKSYRFKGRLYGGDVRGSLDRIEKKTGPAYSLRMTLSDVDLKSGQVMKGMIDRDLEGKLEGAVEYEAQSDNIYDGTGKADLTLSGGKVEVTLPFLELDSLALDRLEIKCELKNRRLNLAQIKFNGPEINAALKGSISLNRELLKSRLNLRGEIEPLPEFFQKLGNTPSTLELLKRRLKAGKLPFMVSGTLDAPRLRLM